MSGYTRPLPAVHSQSIDSVTDSLVAPQGAFTTVTSWATSNLAHYIPVIVRRRVVVTSLWFASASTGTGNYDIGLYDSSGAALLRRGSTAKPASATMVVWNCTDTVIGPGLYYIALALSATGDTVYCVTLAAPIPAAMGMYSEASALPLPATATFAVPQTIGRVPAMGMFLNAIVS